MAQSATARESSDIAAAQAGDANAFVRLVLCHEKPLSRCLRRFTDNETVLQDLLQETYLEMYRSISSYRHEGPFSGWLRQIAARVGYRYWTGQNREARAKTAYLELRRCGTLTPVCDDTECMRDLLAHVAPCDQALLEMRYAQGLTAMEIGAKTGRNVGCIRVRLHRAIKRLRACHGSGRKNEFYEPHPPLFPRDGNQGDTPD